MKYWLLVLLGGFIGLVIFVAVLFDDDSEEVLEAVTSSSISTTTTSSSATTSSAPTTVPPTTTVPTYTGPLYPQLFIDATDEESCSWLGGNWNYGPPGWGKYCGPNFSLASNNSELCEQLGYIWSEEQQRCEMPESDWELNARLNLIEDEDACIDAGGVWALASTATYECRSDEGTIETAYSQDACLERGGTWSRSDYFCYEDDGSLWDARHQATCIDRGGTWSPEKLVPHPEREQPWTRCFLDSGETQYAFDELTCGSRGGIWKTDPDDYSGIQACLSYETEYELEDLFDSGSDWKNVLFRNCENPDEILSQLSGFMIGYPWLDLFWEVDDLSCKPLAPEIEEHFHSPSHTSDLPVVNQEGEETLFYVMTVAWVGLWEVLDIEGPGFANFSRIHDISSKGDVLFSGCAPCWSPGIKGFDDLFIMSSDGTNRRRLFGSCYRYCSPVSFSPDGESFLHFDVYNGSISSGLYQIDLDGNVIRVLVSQDSSQPIIENVSVSPSKTHIAYWMVTDPVLRPNLFVTDFEGSPIQQLTDFDPMDFYSFGTFGGSSIAWSLDETQIGFCIQEGTRRDDFYTYVRDNCEKQFAVSTSASSTSEFEEISLETYELWANQ